MLANTYLQAYALLIRQTKSISDHLVLVSTYQGTCAEFQAVTLGFFSQRALQGIFQGLYFGVGQGLGGLIGGILMQQYGGQKMFAMAAALVMLGWLVAVAAANGADAAAWCKSKVRHMLGSGYKHLPESGF